MNEQAYIQFLVRQMIRPTSPSQDGVPGPEEAAAQEAARSFVRLMDKMPGGFMVYEAGGAERIFYANQSLLRIFACDTQAEFMAHTGGSFRGLVHPDDLEAVEESIRSQIAASQYDLDYVEYRIRRRDGEIRWIEDYGHFLQVEGVGGVFYVFLGDATDKRRMQTSERDSLLRQKQEGEREIRRLTEEYDKERSLVNQEYLRQLEVIEGLSVAYETIWYADLIQDRVVLYRTSPRTQEMLSQNTSASYSQFIQRYISRWVHPEDRALLVKSASLAYIREKLAQSQTYYVNYRVLAEGEIQHLQMRVVNAGNRDNTAEVVMGFRRVDEEIQRHMEEQALLADALAKANLAIASKNAFLSNMSHDMRTPLNAIFGLTSLAKLYLHNADEAKGYLDRVEAASRQLLEMIDKVLEISALADSPNLLQEECRLDQLVEEIYRELLPRAREKDVALAIDCQGIRHPLVFTDRGKLRQMLAYIAANAVTYTESGGAASLSVTEEAPLANHYAVYRFSVSDTGVGMSKEFLDRVFEPFSREKTSTISGVHGVGLGLTIAKSIVDLMGGTLSIESEVGQGSTFTASLTLRFRPQEEQPAPPAAEPRREVRRKILLVEDNAINREIERELLEDQGFSIEEAENGQEALLLLQRVAPGTFDLVLMDLQMPVMDGWAAAEAIRALPDPGRSKIPIVALSANGLERDRQRSKSCGINAHLLKPMDLPLLLKTIRELTELAE